MGWFPAVGSVFLKGPMGPQALPFALLLQNSDSAETFLFVHCLTEVFVTIMES